MSIQWSLVLFTVIAGAGGWLAVAIAVSSLWGDTSKKHLWESAAAVILLAIGGIFSLTHLAHPENILAALNNPTSGIFTEAALVGITAVCIIIYFLVSWRDGSLLVQRVFIVIGAIAGILLSYLSGQSYTMESSQAWNTVFLPLAYMGTIAPAGIAIYFLFDSHRDNSTRFNILVLGLLGLVGLVGSLGYCFAAGVGGVALALAIIAAALSGVLPIIVCFVSLRDKESVSRVCMCVCVVAVIAGAVCFRCAMWLSYDPINAFFGVV